MREFLFDPETHAYTIDGEKLPSVTEIIFPITAGKYPAGAGVIQQAAARGTRVHELCALYDMDALPGEFEGELVPYVQAWADFCQDYSPEWLYIEQPLYFECVAGSSFAGTVDRVGLIDGKLCVVDIKTAQSMDRPAKIALACQLHAYELLNCTLDMSGENMGVQLLKDGSYRIHREKDIEKKYGFETTDLFWSMRKLCRTLKGY